MKTIRATVKQSFRFLILSWIGKKIFQIRNYLEDLEDKINLEAGKYWKEF